MKKRLYIFLSIFGVILLGACSKSDEIPGGGEPTIDKEWIEIDDIVMTSESQIFDLTTVEGHVFPATVDLEAQLFKGARYLLNNFQVKRIVSVGESVVYLCKGNDVPVIETTGAYWRTGEGAMRYCPVVILPQESGTFDFYIEVEEIENPTPRPYAFRSKVYRLVLSKIEGGWNIDSFDLAPGQEESSDE